jgi:hypothetical protein
MRLLLITNTIFEITLGCLFILFPTLLVKENELAISFLRVVGCGAVALGTLSFLMFPLKEPKELKPGLIALSTFHSLVAIALIFNLTNDLTSLFVIIAHLLFAVSFVIVTWKRIILISPNY